MIESLDDALRDMVRAEHGDHTDTEGDEDLPGLYLPLDYVLMTWYEKKEHHLLPEGSGINEQDWRLVYHDWPLVNQRYNRISRELYPPDDEKIPLSGNGKALRDIL